MHVCTSRDTKMCFLSRSWYEFILLSFLPFAENGWTSEDEGKEPFTAFACLFNSRVSSRESEMNEWKSTEISIPKWKWERTEVEEGEKAFNFDCWQWLSTPTHRNHAVPFYRKQSWAAHVGIWRGKDTVSSQFCFRSKSKSQKLENFAFWFLKNRFFKSELIENRSL